MDNKEILDEFLFGFSGLLDDFVFRIDKYLDDLAGLIDIIDFHADGIAPEDEDEAADLIAPEGPNFNDLDSARSIALAAIRVALERHERKER